MVLLNCLSHGVFRGLNVLRSAKLLAEFLAKSELLRKLVDTLVALLPFGVQGLGSCSVSSVMPDSL